MTRVGSLFSGAAALDVVVHQVLDADPAWFVENDPTASTVLAYHYPNVPNYGDVTSVDWASVEPVPILTLGFPCQDVSAAGRRLGLRAGTRSGLWSHASYAISQLRPELVIIENVGGLLSADAACDLEPCPWCLGDNEGRPLRALGAVLGDLAGLGYDARWCGLRASDVGACHGRFRVFITAWPAADTNGVGPVRSGSARRGWSGDPDHSESVADSIGGELQRRGIAGIVDGSPEQGESERTQRQWDGDTTRDRSPATADTSSSRLQGGGLYERAGETAQRDDTPVVADPDSGGRRRDQSGARQRSIDRDVTDRDSTSSVQWGPYEPAIRRWERILGRRAPEPTITGARGGQQLSPHFTEWMMGWPQGWVTAVTGLTRNDMIRICGNGVVPHQAVAALKYLLVAAQERAA